ncbi:MAG TPA: hypothetical protein EYQ27_19980, partial [Gemmatimonadetes bacterium]|nr:hypothetical protein [Gemmatimonadota bacterium]
MHILLTDRLTCPRCGPEFGLILLSHRMEERRVLEGSLGCSNCRERFPIRAGVADLRPPPRGDLAGSKHLEPPTSPSPLEVAALLGVTEAAHAEAVAGLVPGVEVVAIARGLESEEGETEGVSRFVAGSRLPLQSRSLRGVALFGDEGLGRAAELVRVVARFGRVVVWGDVEG